MNRPEILAPAGSMESLVAAVRAGADAVYFGGGAFNARGNAQNFAGGALGEAVAFCHERGAKAYLTLNTLLFADELRPALELAQTAAQNGVDALIVQDAGLAAELRRAAPSLRLHASTQMSLHSLEGVRMAAELGFRRVVLARELSRGEIAYIAARSPVELEVFVHGALCMSVSGQCYLSSLLLRRSGNRGLCAQPCRLPFGAPGGTGHDLSLKDLTLTDRLSDLASLGVCSFKIEGRMKRPEYVAAATDACARAARGEPADPERLQSLQAVFSRSGFTNGYYTGQRTPGMFGIRQKEDVTAAAGVLGSLRRLYDRETPRVEADFTLTLRAGEPARLTVRDKDGNEAAASGPVPEPAEKKALTPEDAAGALRKTGGTCYSPGNVGAEIDPGLAFAAKELNALRRRALAELSALRARPRPVPFTMPRGAEFSTAGRQTVQNPPALRLRLFSFSQLKEALQSPAELIYLPMREVERHLPELRSLPGFPGRLGAELPRLDFSPGGLAPRLAALRRAGVEHALCGNLGGVLAAREAGLKAHGDFGLNVTNPAAFETLLERGLEDCLLSFEQTLPRLRLTAAPDPGRAGLLLYGRLPVMLTRLCPLKNGARCPKEAGGPGRCFGALTDRNRETLPVVCGEGYSEVLNPRPLWMFDRPDETAGLAGFAQLYFTRETPAEVRAVLEACASGVPCPREFTRGLYYHGLG